MKIIHGSLSGLLAEVKERGKVDGVRVAAMMQSTVEGAGLPRYTSWIIVSAQVDWEKWAEWRLVVGRQRAEVSEHGCRVPDKLTTLTEEKVAEVRGWIEAAGLLMRDGILAADAEAPRGRPWLRCPPRQCGPPAPTTTSGGAAPSTSISSSAGPAGTNTRCSAGSARRPIRAPASCAPAGP
jgi:hypothetical protein